MEAQYEIDLFYLFILLALPTYYKYKYIRVIKQNNKEKVARIPQQREPISAGPDN